MIEENATVIETRDGLARVEACRRSACSGCEAEKGCGTATLGKVLGQRTTSTWAENGIDAKPGEAVVVGIDDRTLLLGSMAVYLAPLLALFLFALLGRSFAEAFGIMALEAVTITSAIIGMGCGFAWVRRYSVRIGRDKRHRPVILRRAGVALCLNSSELRTST